MANMNWIFIWYSLDYLFIIDKNEGRGNKVNVILKKKRQFLSSQLGNCGHAGQII